MKDYTMLTNVISAKVAYFLRQAKFFLLNLKKN